jgi:hypothetical protein
MVFRAAQYTSRAMRGPLRCPYGTCGVAGVTVEAGLRIGDVAGVVVAIISFGFVAPAGFFRARRRFGIFCRSSHTRSVSSEIVTPSFVSDCTSSRIDAPARRSASSTSRYGSSAANRRERGRRPSAINRASVWALPVEVPAAPCVVEGESTGAVVSRIGGSAGTAVPSAGGCPVASGARESCSPAAAGASFGFMPADYRAWSGCAMGALRSRSKPQGLDVGVPASSFLWVFVSQFASLRLRLSVRRSIAWLVEVSRSCSGELVQREKFGYVVFLSLAGWSKRMIRCLGCSTSCSVRRCGVIGGGSW